MGRHRLRPPSAEPAQGVAVRQLLPLAAIAVVVTVLAWANVLPRWPGLPHLVALPPLDLFADLRVLLTRATSVPAFVLFLALVLTLRVLVMAVMLGGLSWRRVRLAASFYGVLLLPMLIAAEVDYIAFAVLYARPFWIVVASVAILVLLAGPVPWQGSTRMRTALTRTWRGGLRVGILLPYGAVVVLLGVATDVWPGSTVILVPISALATGVTIWLLSRPPRSGALLRLAVAGVAFLAAGSAFVATRQHEPPPPPSAREGSLMVMSGISSSSGHGAVFHTRPEHFGLTCEQMYYYSYKGPGDGQPRGFAKCPIRTGAPFEAHHTRRPMEEQAAVFAEQVRGLPRPLRVMAHSHSAWVVWMAVADGMAPEVDVLILNGPFQESIQGYPPPGENAPGKVAGDLLRVFMWAANHFGALVEPDAPATRATLGDPGTPPAIFARPLPPGVRAIALHAAADLPLQPSGWRLPVEHNACPLRVAHTELPKSDAIREEVNRFLDGRPPPPCPPWRDWGAAMTRGFSVPAAPNLHPWS
ncbi:hypothetical protein GCM10012275_56970 [Longimycelium tulufanense]|uniref:Uncharacterized protein n=1 Tax=Longimycelium tulufanense TaxID=907463 RepID=A0A8J3FXE3_9PSEU|nr:hypothetical protein [Longimycelium tulufanense]GGM78939.1 hypothetical protein GCM10012275_56970 [Longimycelium tulufanense]